MAKKTKVSPWSNWKIITAVVILIAIISIVVLYQEGYLEPLIGAPVGEFVGRFCFDSDPNNSIYVKGHVRIDNRTVWDTCSRGNVVERFCVRERERWRTGSAIYSCPSRHTCRDGVCVPAFNITPRNITPPRNVSRNISR